MEMEMVGGRRVELRKGETNLYGCRKKVKRGIGIEGRLNFTTFR